jgi:hypothetical protein
MRRFARGSAFTLVAALGVAAAYAAWHSGGPVQSARLAPPRLPAISMAAGPVGDLRDVLGAPVPGNALCVLVGCDDALAVDAAEFCSACFDPTDLTLSDLDGSGLDRSETSLGGTSPDAFAPEFHDDPDPFVLTSFEPSAAAAATPEISTAAMLTLGFAGIVWTARRTRRRMLRPGPAPPMLTDRLAPSYMGGRAGAGG